LRTRDLIELVTLAAIWGGSFLFMRIAAPEFGPVALITVRCSLAAVLLFMLILSRGKFTELLGNWKKLTILGLINSCIPFLLFAWATLHIPTGIASILNATVPLFGAVVAVLWLGDRISAMRVLGLVVAFAGVVVLMWGQGKLGNPNSLWAIAACLLAGLLYGIASSYTKRYMQGADPLVNAAGSQISATAFLLPVVGFFIPPAMPSNNAWIAALLLAVVCTAVAYILFFRLIANVGPTKAITVTFLIPVFGCLFGGLILNEALTMAMMLGGLIVVLGVSMAIGLWPKKTA
jgi:drug/metabolite transporter (DMT)-like permease